MKIRLIAAALLLATVLGLLGCASAPSGETVAGALENPELLPGSELRDTDDGEAVPENLLNVAALDEDDKPLFQIVYNIGASLRVQEQCETLAAEIYNATGVTLPVVHSMDAQKTYEITVGEIARKETIDVIDGFDLGDNDFTICVVGTRVLIYAETDHALVSAVIYFMDQIAYRSEMQRIYGVAADTNFTYQPSGEPSVTVEESENDRYINITLQDGAFSTYVRLSYTGNKGWRIQTKYRKVEPFKDDGAAQILAYSLGEYELGTEDGRFYTEPVRSSRVGGVLRVRSEDGSRADVSLDSKNFGIRFYTSEGNLSQEITGITCNAGGSSITGTLNPGEAVFGTGERFNATNQRGKQIEMFTKDIWSKNNACYMAIPLLCFSRGSGVFINNYEHMVLDLDSKKQNVWSANVTGALLDCYIYTTDEIEEVIHNYSRLSGYANMPEEWTYGMIVCAYSPDLSQKWTASITPSDDGRGEGVYEMIANMEANDLPWTGVLAEGWGPYSSHKHQDLKELCDYVHSLGKKFLVYMRVGSAGSGMHGFRNEYLLTQTRLDGTESFRLPDTTADTNNPDVGTNPGARTNVYIDVTNPQAVNWFFGEYWDYLSYEIGIDGCKIDFCETLPENFELNYFDENIPTAGSHHWYPTAFCAMYFDMISSKPDSGMCYTRGGGIGSQRAPFMWAGDQMRYWDGIRWQITAIMSSGLSGVPFMSYDMSGYQYGSNVYKEISYESQVFLRGTQFSAYTVCIQTHGKVRRSYQFAEFTDENGNHPYAYVTEIYRAYTKLHEHLTPYITELSEDACATGMPVMRHLVRGWQDDANVYGIEDEFMLGDAFLVAPILNNGTVREVYLPEGSWKDLNTGAVYEVGAEGQRISVTASIAELPTFFNTETESETARELVDGIEELYDYARTLVP